jgi:hypothetical protein
MDAAFLTPVKGAGEQSQGRVVGNLEAVAGLDR